MLSAVWRTPQSQAHPMATSPYLASFYCSCPMANHFCLVSTSLTLSPSRNVACWLTGSSRHHQQDSTLQHQIAYTHWSTKLPLQEAPLIWSYPHDYWKSVMCRRVRLWIWFSVSYPPCITDRTLLLLWFACTIIAITFLVHDEPIK